MYVTNKKIFFFFLKFKDEKIKLKEKERHGAPQDVKAMQSCMKLSKHLMHDGKVPSEKHHLFEPLLGLFKDHANV